MKKLLVVDGNTDQGSINIKNFEGLSYIPLFTKAIQSCGEFEIDASYPTREGFIQPSIDELKKYDGILWTGSSLSVNETPEFVKPQILLCQTAFESQTPIYGSCWELQVAVAASGGKVKSAQAGYEIGVMDNLSLTKEGKAHYLFKNKTEPISSFCVHKDYIEEVPPNSTLLAFNEFCPVQALEIKHKGGVFVGVQYHPEFDSQQMISTYHRLHDLLLKSEYFSSSSEHLNAIGELEDEIEKNETAFYNNEKYRLLEIRNWLDTL
ncbi:MAG: type 1 glutamine amidotransferase [Campylobacteraceae bacterium]|nr:type 1 glutamine amidotransferase [Campylobacteraceae bacterium]